MARRRSGCRLSGYGACSEIEQLFIRHG